MQRKVKTGKKKTKYVLSGLTFIACCESALTYPSKAPCGALTLNTGKNILFTCTPDLSLVRFCLFFISDYPLALYLHWRINFKATVQDYLPYPAKLVRSKVWKTACLP
ncbi:hypothetical protein KCP69_15245 [Salmonella enterica subsp. enterica]|nr:hypothetical protein KCP69_15245 [Salmonella enterica subsp. enterica]